MTKNRHISKIRRYGRTFIARSAILSVMEGGFQMLDEFSNRWKRQIHVVLAHLTIPLLVVVDIVAFNVHVVFAPLEILRHANLE